MVVSISMARARMHAPGVFSKLFWNPPPIFPFFLLIAYLCEIPDPSACVLWKGRSGPFRVLHLTCCSGCLTCDA